METPLRRIHRLPSDLAEKIAAGEVIERPSSVIKELVENSIDAGATKVVVEIVDGGKESIRVIDNGSGIFPEDLPLALERHATSKITKLDDLWNLSSMGFRGEALPSVSAISRFTIESRVAGQVGRKLYLEGGILKSDQPLGATSAIASSGTSLTVENLFYNVPARLKFLKAKSGETSQLRDLIERIALSHPGVHFTFSSDGRKSLDLPTCSSEAARVAQVFGTSENDLEHFSTQFEGSQVWGYLDRNARMPNSRSVYLSVNHRMVRDKLLQQAVLLALRPRMMEGEYPKIFVQVLVPPNQVDVNVHPAKSEVRFERSRDVFQLVHGVIERSGRETNLAFYASPDRSYGWKEPSKINHAFSTEKLTPQPVAAAAMPLLAGDPAAARTVFRTKTDIGFDSVPLANSAREQTSPFSRLQYIGQLKNTYLLCQDETGLVLIDQHAADERVQYERLKKELSESGLKSQPLLISATHKCSDEDAALAIDYGDLFARLGLEIESFGTNCILIRTVPEMLSQQHALELFQAMLAELKSLEGASSVSLVNDPTRHSAKLERLIATMACHSAVRAGQALSEREARALMATMDRTDFALNCPHGRPASIQLSYSQVEGLFKR
ncbi:MAG TPA: DNA mismatch repair endonuclease MutL [Oligoflexia bacterium]|nr:DNA mismatch repair endonuclease MutL [Oligoflexia bacterium]